MGRNKDERGKGKGEMRGARKMGIRSKGVKAVHG